MFDKYSRLKEQLKELNLSLGQRWHKLLNRDELRSLLAAKVGQIRSIIPLSEGEIAEWPGSGGLVAVDGSVNTYGGNYPYFIHFFRALARSTQGREAQRAEFFSPLGPDGFAILERLAQDTNVPIERCAEGYRNQRLAQLEIEAALEILQENHPALMLMDGGFLRLQQADEKNWDKLRQLARNKGCIVVGVIEEVGTFQLASMLGIQSTNGAERIFDRELLFGNLSEGEWLRVEPGQEWKFDYYTCFARLSAHPQAIGLDLFPEDVGQLERVIRFLYTITPQGSRGLPLWLDIIDHDVRITSQEVKLLITSTLDPNLIEGLLTAQRQRRDF